MREITKQEFLEGYEQGLITEVVSVGNRVYGRNVKGQGDNLQGYEVVYANVL